MGRQRQLMQHPAFLFGWAADRPGWPWLQTHAAAARRRASPPACMLLLLLAHSLSCNLSGLLLQDGIAKPKTNAAGLPWLGGKS